MSKTARDLHDDLHWHMEDDQPVLVETPNGEVFEVERVSSVYRDYADRTVITTKRCAPVELGEKTNATT